MDPRFAVLRHLKSLGYKDTREAGSWLAGDLIFHSNLKNFGKHEALELFDCVFDAFPDWEIIHSEPVVEDGLVHLFIRMEGTHTNTLLLPLPGIKAVAATGTRVMLDKQRFSCKVVDDKIVEIWPEVNERAGLLGILKQVGGKVPPIWWLKLMWSTSRKIKKQKEIAG